MTERAERRGRRARDKINTGARRHGGDRRAALRAARSSPESEIQTARDREPLGFGIRGLICTPAAGRLATDSRSTRPPAAATVGPQPLRPPSLRASVLIWSRVLRPLRPVPSVPSVPCPPSPPRGYRFSNRNSPTAWRRGSTGAWPHSSDFGSAAMDVARLGASSVSSRAWSSVNASGVDP